MSAKRMSEAEETLRKLAALPNPEYKALHAKFLFQTGQRAAALAEFEALAQAAPDDRRARGRLVAAYVQMNRIQAAEDLLAQALKKNPKDTDALLQRSVLYLQAGKVAEAGTDLREVIHYIPGSSPAHFALAAVYKMQGLVRSEREELNEALRLNPNLLPARLWLVQSLLVAEQNEAALSALDQAPAPQKQSLAVIVERNWALLFLGRDREVRPILDRALRYGPFPELVLQDAVLKMKEGNFAAARTAAEQVLKQDPENARAAHVVVDSYVAQKQNGKAGEWLAGIVAARPQSAPLQYLLGQWYESLHRNAEARRAFESADAAGPKFSRAELSLAELDLQENQIGAARKRLLDLVNADRKNVKALLLLATVEDSSGDPAAAIPYYREVLGLDGNNIYALNNLANHLTTENPDEALKLAQQAAEVVPDNPAVQDTLGWIYYRKGMYGMAVEHLKAAASKAANPRRQLHLGMAYLKSGEHDLGRNMVALALQSDPSLAREQGW
jgi:tetratricopeptide (TPR) repeat protein